MLCGWSAVSLAALGATDVRKELEAAAKSTDHNLAAAAAATLAGRWAEVKWEQK